MKTRCSPGDAMNSLHDLQGQVMTGVHPNISLIKRLDPSNLADAKDLIAEDAVLHYFNPNLPEMQGDYVGLDRIRAFFEMIGQRTSGTFKVSPVSVTAVGDELVVAQTRNTLSINDQAIALDVVVVWRILAGQIVEMWDIVPIHPSESKNE